MRTALYLLGAALISLALVEAARRYALRRGVLDIPNDRSSHARPTPRGGGFGLVVPIAAALLFLAPFPGWMPTVAATAAVALVATVGWIDDHRSLAVRTRIGVHVAAGLLVAAITVRAGSAAGGGAAAALIALEGLWWVFWTVSAINVLNFMDGADAFVALQGVVFGGFAWLALPPGSAPAALALVVVGAFAGFLVLNRPPAKIFMGDVGSGAVGVTFVLLGVLVMRATGWSAIAAFLPLAPLFIDEVLTMIARRRRGESLTVAHRSHYYQRLIQAGWGHGASSLLFAALALPGAALALALGGRTALLLVGAAAYILGAALFMHGLTRAVERRATAGSGAA